MTIQLAKPAMDVGLFFDGALEPMLDHWQQKVGTPFDELLPTGQGLRQHRHRLGDSVLKLNHARDPLTPQPASGYRRLLVASDALAAETDVTDPRGNRVALVPRGDVTQLRLIVETAGPAAQLDFYARVLGLDRISDRVFAVGSSQIEVVRGAASAPHDLRAPGFRYVTLQVFDVLREHARILELGGIEGRAPIQLGRVAYISFVRDPSGNWIEISQRASLTGELPKTH